MGHKIEAIASFLETRRRSPYPCGVRTPRGVGEWKAGTVSQLLVRLPG
jgi:hypothetical protein